jgi:hypothetical protein
MSKYVCTFSTQGSVRVCKHITPFFPTKLMERSFAQCAVTFPPNPLLDKGWLYLMHRNNLGVNLQSQLWRITCHWKTHSVHESPVSTHKNCEKLNHITSRLKCFDYNHTLEGVCYLNVMYVPCALYMVFISTNIYISF